MAEVLFSVVIPVLNRAAILPRALDSALAHTRDDVEVIVVDDGSTDGTPDVVRAYRDPRVRLIALPVNRGVCAARNAAIEAARGRWCVMLDSDFELLPGAFDTLAALCAEAPDDVANVATVCTWSDRGDTPDPLPETDLLLDYPGYLRFVAGLRTSEWFGCIRRSALQRIRFPEGRAYEATFHLALARRYRFQLRLARVVRIHTDAPDRITVASPARFATRATARPTRRTSCGGTETPWRRTRRASSTAPWRSRVSTTSSRGSAWRRWRCSGGCPPRVSGRRGCWRTSR